MDFSGEVFGDGDDQGDFAVVGHAEGDDAGTELLAEAVDQLAQTFHTQLVNAGITVNALSQ